MKLRLALKPQADRDINSQFEYIAKDNLEAAIVFTKRLSVRLRCYRQILISVLLVSLRTQS